jgi:hypothetical protein
MRDAWRVIVTFGEPAPTGRAARELSRHEIEAQVRPRLHAWVAVSVTDPHLYLCNGTRNSAVAAEEVSGRDARRGNTRSGDRHDHGHVGPGRVHGGQPVHAAETADLAALSGRHAARQIAADLAWGLLAGTTIITGPCRRRASVALDFAERPRRRLAASPSGRASSGRRPGWRHGKMAGCLPGHARCD